MAAPRRLATVGDSRPEFVWRFNARFPSCRRGAPEAQVRLPRTAGQRSELRGSVAKGHRAGTLYAPSWAFAVRKK